MTILLETKIPGQPVGKARPRITTRYGKTVAYTPAKTRNWESMAAKIFKRAWGQRPPYDGPSQIHVVAVSRRPQRLLRKKDPHGRMWRQAKPDGDNVLKSVADAIEKAGVVKDDKDIVRMSADSVYAAKGEEECVWVKFGDMLNKECTDG